MQIKEGSVILLMTFDIANFDARFNVGIPELKYLLEARADPNMPVKPGDASPLQNVMSFGRERHVSEMRDLLLRFGANESDDDRARWELRRRADFCERIRINSYNHVDRKYDPVSGNEDY